MISVSARHRQGDFNLDANFTSDGRVVALVGVSGAGKTTLVNVIAGLIKPDHGRVEIDGAVLLDTAKNVFVVPAKRRIGYVFQDGRLFPHMTVRGNLFYGYHRGETIASPDEIIDLLGIAPLLTRKPATLSGGERQRVAIGRALLSAPRVLLMDEPLASLDTARKAEVLPYIERLRDHIRLPIIYVSHAMDEVERLADKVIRLDAGGIV